MARRTARSRRGAGFFTDLAARFAPKTAPLAPKSLPAASIPVATPIVQPSTTLSPAEKQLVTSIVYVNDNPRFIDSIVAAVVKGAVAAKNKERNLALLAALPRLAERVKELYDTGVPAMKPNELPGDWANFNAYTAFERLTDPEFREVVAQQLVSMQGKETKDARQYLSGAVNMVASAIRTGMQRKLLLGGRKTRRSTRRA